MYDEKVSIVENFLREIGKRDLTLQCDGESTLISLVETVADRFTSREGPNVYRIIGRYTSSYTSNSNGSVERAIRLIRDQLRVMFGAIQGVPHVKYVFICMVIFCPSHEIRFSVSTDNLWHKIS